MSKKNRTEIKWGYLLLALLTFGIGVLFFAYNNKSLEGLAIIIGVTVVVSAAVVAARAIADKKRGGQFALKVVYSVALLVSGGVVLIGRSLVMDLVVAILGLVIIIDGTMKFHTTAMAKRYEAIGWIAMLILSMILIAGGFITVKWLSVENEITVYLLGAFYIIEALANILTMFYLSFIEKKNEIEIIEKLGAEANKPDSVNEGQ